MSDLQHFYKYAPDVEKSGWLADQVGQSHQIQYMDHAYTGTAYNNMYDHSGDVNKAIPLTKRPMVNQTYRGFKGLVVPRNQAIGFYDIPVLYYRRC